ncbi:MAG: peptidase T [Candidatus Merdivicinus sp.]|jgi:tripeptide aminopeptidase
MKETVLEKFLRYIAVDTTSDPETGTHPSTPGQLVLGKMLVEELKQLGLADARQDSHGYVYASIPATPGKETVPALGFIAHLDTSCAVSGQNIHPVITRNYDGGDILLNEEQNLILSPKEFPSLLQYVGKTIVSTDGTTLLGGDDKGGIAGIMGLLEYLAEHPEFPHGKICIGFTPDEEIGEGADYFDVPGFGAQFAYTVDGGMIGELEYENFNAASANLTFHGKSIHPGSAKGQMVNAILLAMEFNAMLPVFENPACTENREGFHHIDVIRGGVERTDCEYIIRDHDRTLFEKKKENFRDAALYLNRKYGEGTVELTLTDSYYNMLEKIEPHMHLIENAKSVMESMGIEPKILPVRGGTDGSRLSYMGLPCPNLFTGGHNGHGRFEYTVAESLEKIPEILLGILRKYAE